VIQNRRENSAEKICRKKTSRKIQRKKFMKKNRCEILAGKICDTKTARKIQRKKIAEKKGAEIQRKNLTNGIFGGKLLFMAIGCHALEKIAVLLAAG
jgi:hypothetical protein